MTPALTESLVAALSRQRLKVTITKAVSLLYLQERKSYIYSHDLMYTALPQTQLRCRTVLVKWFGGFFLQQCRRMLPVGILEQKAPFLLLSDITSNIPSFGYKR
jgi:hypothetical protein